MGIGVPTTIWSDEPFSRAFEMMSSSVSAVFRAGRRERRFTISSCIGRAVANWMNPRTAVSFAALVSVGIMKNAPLVYGAGHAPVAETMGMRATPKSSPSASR